MVEDTMAGAKNVVTVFPHDDDEVIAESEQDSVTDAKVPSIFETNYGGLGKDVDELIEDGAYVDNNGHVIASLKPVTGYTDFSSVVTEQEGYYFPFEINMPGAKTMSFEKTTTQNGTYVKTKTDIPYDHQIVLRVAGADGAEDQQIYDFKITSDNGKTVEVHFDKVKFM